MPRFSLSGVGVRTLGVAALLPSLLFSDPQEDWSSLKQRAALAERNGSFKQAESLLHSALATLRPDQKAEAVILWNNLGAVDYNGRQSEAAMEASRRALALNQSLAHPDEEQSAVALNNLGTITGEQGNPAEAWSLLLKAHAMLEKNDQIDTRTAALLQGNLALTAQQLGNTAEAVRLYPVAADKTQRFYGDRSIEYARILTNQAFSDLRRGAYSDAASHARKAYIVERSLPFADARDLALAATHLSLALAAQGQLPEAEAWAHTALDQAVLQSGTDLQVCAFNNLASVQEKAGKLALAAEAERRAIALLQNAPGKVSDVTAMSVWTNMARIALGQGQTRQTRGYLENALRIGEQAKGSGRVSYAAVLTNVADFESRQKHYKRAEALYRKALEIDISMLGDQHPQTASDRSNVATQLAYLGKRAEALELYAQARDAMQKTLGTGSSEVARVWRNMAVTYYSDKQFEKSAVAYAEALRVLDRPASSIRMDLAPLLHEYALALRKAQRFAEAETVETRAVGLEVRGAVSAEHTSGKS